MKGRVQAVVIHGAEQAVQFILHQVAVERDIAQQEVARSMVLRNRRILRVGKLTRGACFRKVILPVVRTILTNERRKACPHFDFAFKRVYPGVNMMQ